MYMYIYIFCYRMLSGVKCDQPISAITRIIFFGSQRITQECGSLRLEKRPVSQRFLISWSWYGLQLWTAQNEDLNLWLKNWWQQFPTNHQPICSISSSLAPQFCTPLRPGVANAPRGCGANRAKSQLQSPQEGSRGRFQPHGKILDCSCKKKGDWKVDDFGWFWMILGPDPFSANNRHGPVTGWCPMTVQWELDLRPTLQVLILLPLIIQTGEESNFCRKIDLQKIPATASRWWIGYWKNHPVFL